MKNGDVGGLGGPFGNLASLVLILVQSDAYSIVHTTHYQLIILHNIKFLGDLGVIPCSPV